MKIDKNNDQGQPLNTYRSGEYNANFSSLDGKIQNVQSSNPI